MLTWVFLYLIQPDTRKQMLFTSFAWAHTGPIIEYWHRQDYWAPVYDFPLAFGSWEFGVEDYLFSFAYTGVCIGVFEHFRGQTLSESDTAFDLRTFLCIQLLASACISGMVLFAHVFGITTFWSILIVHLLFAAYFYRVQPALLFTGIATAFFLFMLSWVSWSAYFLRLYPDLIEQWWHSESLSGVHLGNVPIEEPLWAAVVAFFLGPAVLWCAERGDRM